MAEEFNVVFTDSLQNFESTDFGRVALGLSAYQIAAYNGYTGTQSQWLQSLKGETGAQGIQGEQGSPGEIGIQGIQGDTGLKGDTGDIGLKGDTGDSGVAISETEPTNDANVWINPNGTGSVLEAWITPTLLNGWLQATAQQPLRFYKDNLGIVHIEGTIRAGAAQTIAFVLPDGYCPSGQLMFPIIASDFFGQLRITSDGNVTVWSFTSSTWVSINVSFRV